MSRHSHIHVNYKAKDYVVKPNVEVANWSSANRSYLSPIKPGDWAGGVKPKPKPPVIIVPPVVPDPEPDPDRESNYGVLSGWFAESSVENDYVSPDWDRVTSYDELASL